jgi:hypothetical protein
LLKSWSSVSVSLFALGLALTSRYCL